MMINEAAAGAAVYSKRVLAIYDLFVLGFSNTFAWRCPSPRLLRFYNEHISGRHLDVGVGTGYFLDKCRFPTPNPSLTLLDLNRNSLEAATRRLARYRPQTVQADALQPLAMPTAGYDSISLGYLLHCLPGTLSDKAVIFHQARRWLNPSGILFGTTILGRGVPHNPLAKTLLRIYNRRGIFSNRADDAASLEQVLAAHFEQYQVDTIGCVALFAATTKEVNI